MIVGPQHCQHCSRAIYPTAGGWAHGHNRLAVCYSPAGDPRHAEPRPNAAARSELER